MHTQINRAKLSPLYCPACKGICQHPDHLDHQQARYLLFIATARGTALSDTPTCCGCSRTLPECLTFPCLQMSLWIEEFELGQAVTACGDLANDCVSSICQELPKTISEVSCETCQQRGDNCLCLVAKTEFHALLGEHIPYEYKATEWFTMPHIGFHPEHDTRGVKLVDENESLNPLIKKLADDFAFLFAPDDTLLTDVQDFLFINMPEDPDEEENLFNSLCYHINLRLESAGLSLEYDVLRKTDCVLIYKTDEYRTMLEKTGL